MWILVFSFLVYHCVVEIVCVRVCVWVSSMCVCLYMHVCGLTHVKMTTL